MHSKQTSTLHGHFNFLSLSGHRAPDLSRRNPSSKILIYLISMKQSVHHSQNEMFSRSAWFRKRIKKIQEQCPDLHDLHVSVSIWQRRTWKTKKYRHCKGQIHLIGLMPHIQPLLLGDVIGIVLLAPWHCTRLQGDLPGDGLRRLRHLRPGRSDVSRLFHVWMKYDEILYEIPCLTCSGSEYFNWLVLDLFFFKNTKYHKSTK